MICYFDASALTKRYVAEVGTDMIQRIVLQAEIGGTSLISRVEVVAAIAKALRLGWITDREALASRRIFSLDWRHLACLTLSEGITERAATLAWQHSLRGFDAVHLATACAWREALDQPVTMACFDRRLWEAAAAERFEPYPPNLPDLLEAWRK